MQLKRILIVGSEGIFISGLLIRLQEIRKLKVYRTDGENIIGVIATIVEIEPDVIVMDDSVGVSISDLLFELPENYSLNVIIINTKENKLQIFNTKKIHIKTMEDFIEVLEPIYLSSI